MFNSSLLRKAALATLPAFAALAAIPATAGASVATRPVTTDTPQISAAAPQTHGVFTGPDTLAPGKALTKGHYIVSPDGQYFYGIHHDSSVSDNCILAGASYPDSLLAVVPSGCPDKGVNQIVMQTDGNLVAYTSTGKVLFQSGTEPHAGAYLQITDDGVIAVHASAKSGGAVLWSSHLFGLQDIFTNTNLYPNWRLNSGPHAETGISGSGVLVMQTDGNLVYTENGTVRWTSATAGHAGAHARLGSDGNLKVISSAGTVLWSSHTTSPKATALTLDSRDGTTWQLLLKDAAYNTIWSRG